MAEGENGHQMRGPWNDFAIDWNFTTNKSVDIRVTGSILTARSGTMPSQTVLQRASKRT